MAKKIFTDESLNTFVEEIKSYANDAASVKADKEHSHDDIPGKKVEGQTITVDDVEYTGGVNAEIFNDYEANVAAGEYSHAEGCYNKALGDYSHAEGAATTASEYASHSEGYQTKALGPISHAEGMNTATTGQGAHAEGNSSTMIPASITPDSSVSAIETAWNSAKFTLARGIGSHAEGNNTLAMDTAAHSEGYETKASGAYSHAQGYKTEASGSRAHAEGQGSVASGADSHAEGLYTIAAGANQHAQGKYNVKDTAGTYAHIVGNGSNANNRKNAHTLDWSGNAWYAGNVTGGSIVSKGTSTTNPQIQFFENGATSYNNNIYSKSDYMYFEGAQGYEFDDNIRTSSNLYANGKRTLSDGKDGVAFGSGSAFLQASAPSIRFMLSGSTDSSKPDGKIYLSANDYMYFEGAQNYYFDKGVFSDGMVGSGTKRNFADGLSGCILTQDGTIAAQGTSNARPQLRFYQNGSTETYDSRIYSQDDVMNFEGASSYSFDKSIKSTDGGVYVSGSVLTGGKTTYNDGEVGIHAASSGNLHIQHSSAPSVRLYKGTSTSDGGRIALDSSGYMQFTQSPRYQFSAQIYSTTSTIGTSDRNMKKDFKEFDYRYENLFFDLKPQVYKFKDGTSDRFHSGFISQDVEESMFANGLDSKDFAGYVKDIQKRTLVDTDEEFIEEEVYDENGNPVYDYYLRYEEFIALNTHMLQKAYKQIDEMKETIDELKAEIANLKN